MGADQSTTAMTPRGVRVDPETGRIIPEVDSLLDAGVSLHETHRLGPGVSSLQIVQDHHAEEHDHDWQPEHPRVALLKRTTAMDQERQDKYIEETLAAHKPLDPYKIGPLPFMHDWKPWTVYEVLRTILMIPFFPLRITVMLCAVCFHYCVVVIMTAGQSLESLTPFRRRTITFSARCIARLVLFSLGFYWIPVRGRANMDRTQNRPAAIIMNHQSYVDILTGVWLCNPGFVAKEAVSHVPMVGRIAKAGRAMFVRRSGSKEEAREMNEKLVQDLIDRQRQYDGVSPQIIVFPEGTTSNGKYMLPFRKGVFMAGCPVQPTLLKFHYSRFAPHWETISTRVSFFRMMTQFVNRMEVIILPVYYPSQEEKLDSLLFGENVRREMAHALGVPFCDGSWQEKYKYHDLVKSKTITVQDYLKVRKRRR